MSKKSLTASLVAIPVLFFICWIGYIKISEINAPKLIVAVEGYDPRDLISGHYLSLRLNWQETDCSAFGTAGCPLEKFGYRYIYRYYVPEHDAPILEKLMMKWETKAALEFVLPGNAAPRIKNLLINGKPWQDAVK